MHEKAKEFLGKIGASHRPDTKITEEHGMAHKEMHGIEGKMFEGKKHHKDMEI